MTEATRREFAAARQRIRRVVLVGPMGVGKTTIGAELARRLGWPLRDCDDQLWAWIGRTAADIAATDGVPRLHELEASTLLRSLAMSPPDVVTAAASTIESPDCVRAVRQQDLVAWLDAPTDRVVARLIEPGHRRSLPLEAAAALVEQRRGGFQALAGVRLDADRPVEEIVSHLVTLVTGSQASEG
jgi:shikimate kinase